MNESFKLQAIANELQKNKEAVFIFWFEETLQRVKNILAEKDQEQSSLLNTREVVAEHLAGKTVLFGEHYPLFQKENDFFDKMHLNEITIWSALDEPLFKEFGGEKIIQMMKQMGMKEDQSIQNNMISKAIHNAQEKISNKVVVDQSSLSQEEWLHKNWKQ